MYTHRTRSAYRSRLRLKRLLLIIAAMAAVVVVITVVTRYSGRSNTGAKGERRELMGLWEAGSFNEVYSLSQAALESRPLDYFLLTMNGFSAYQLGYAQINSLSAAQYFDDCILKLRKAMLLKEARSDGRLNYVLGKAYHYKGSSYADLSVKFLESARTLGYSAADIPEYLGLSYKAMGDYRNSVAAFSEALGSYSAVNGASGRMLLQIADSYYALEEFDMARAYLQRCIEVSADSRSVLSARLLLSEILSGAKDYAGAEKQLFEIIAEVGDNADAHYLLGELYALQGDIARARAEWRLALRADPAHLKARARLSM